jgi:hypothetical protein
MLGTKVPHCHQFASSQVTQLFVVFFPVNRLQLGPGFQIGGMHPGCGIIEDIAGVLGFVKVRTA